MLAAPAAGADVADLANSTRLESCSEAPATTGRLRPNPRLDDAARRIAGGQDLQTATAAAGYRAKSSASIHVATAKGNARIREMLAQRFCGILGDPELREIGAFQRGDGTWLVLARPLIPDASAGELEDRVLELINEARRQPHRCGSRQFEATTPVRSDAALAQAALAHARDLSSRGRLAHQGSDGSMPADRVTRAGYRWKAVAENIASGQPTAEEVVETWLESPGHCENLMNPRYSETGIAHAVNRDVEQGIYWVQVFAEPG